MKRLTHFDIGYGCHILNDNNDIWFYPEEVDINVKTSNSEISGNVIEKLAEYEKLGTVEDFQETLKLQKIRKNRPYYKKYLEEVRANDKKLLYPDFDEIYKKYFELKNELEVYKRALYNALEECKYIEIEENVMPNFLEEARKELKDE